MPFGSNRAPAWVGLGAAAVFAVGGVTGAAPASADDGDTTSPTPTDSGTDSPPPDSPPPDSPPPDSPPPDSPPPDSPPPDSPPPDSPPPDSPPPDSPPPDSPPPSSGDGVTPVVSVGLSVSKSKVAPGSSVAASVRVNVAKAVAHHVALRMSATNASVSGSRDLGDVGTGGASASGTVKIPSSLSSTTVTVTAWVSADGTGLHSASRSITVTSAFSSSSRVMAPTGSLAGGSPFLPFESAPTSFGKLPHDPDAPQLPQIAAAPAVAAPQLAGTGVTGPWTVLRSGESPLSVGSAFYRLVLTQLAWLVSLLVAVGLLMTQVRLNRLRPAAARPGRSKRKRKTGK